MTIDLSPLKFNFDHLRLRLQDSLLHPLNNEVTAQVHLLMDKQETASHKCRLILENFFNASIIETTNVAVNNWQEFAALNLLVDWFLCEAERIEKNLTGMFSDVDIGRLSISEGHAGEDAVKEKVPVQELGPGAEGSADGGSSVHAIRDAVRAQESKAENQQVGFKMLHGTSSGTAKDKGKEHQKTRCSWNDDRGELGRILKKANRLDNQIAPMLTDLFFLLKRYDQKIPDISHAKASLKQAGTGEDEPRFIEKAIDLLELADMELNRIKHKWVIEGVDGDREGRSPEEKTQDVAMANKLIDKLMGLALSLECFREFLSLSEPGEEDMAMLEKTLQEKQAEIHMFQAKVDSLEGKVKHGKFISVVVALANAADCIGTADA